MRTGDRGWGLQLMQDIHPGELITQCVGEVISVEGMMERSKVRRAQGIVDAYYFDMGGGSILDCGHKGNVGRFVNHSCQPNCEFEKWVVGGEDILVLVASVAVPAFTELSVDYRWEHIQVPPSSSGAGGDDSSGEDALPPPRSRCFCGAPRCRGYIDMASSCSETDAICGVCHRGETNEGNDIVFCDGPGCNVAVHQKCYHGLATIPSDDWFCDVCVPSNGVASNGVPSNGTVRVTVCVTLRM